MAKASLEALGVPDWARRIVAKAEPNRRLEGLIAPGRYDVRPGSSAEEVLKILVTGRPHIRASGLPSGRVRPVQPPTSCWCRLR